MRKTKASITEQQDADATPFTQWMISIDRSPKDHKDWENEYNTKCALALEELDATMKSIIVSYSLLAKKKSKMASKTAVKVLDMSYLEIDDQNSHIMQNCHLVTESSRCKLHTRLVFMKSKKAF